MAENLKVLTTEVLIDYGFSAFDLGDYNQFEREDIVIIQPKLQVIAGINIGFTVAMPKQSEPVTLNLLHELRDFYRRIKQREL